MLSPGVFSDGYVRVTQGRSSRELTKTRAVTIDQLADQFGPPTHVKVDVEGHEAAVVTWCKKNADPLRPAIFLELHNQLIRSEGGDPGRVLDDLAEMRYEVFTIDGVKIDLSSMLWMPICRLVGKCR